MTLSKSLLLVLGLSACLHSMHGQNRLPYNSQQLFLSGSNVAWVNFAHDVGPDNTNFASFRAIFDSVHAHHGNVMRLWLHTNGASSPAFNAAGKVTGPGANTISDIQAILDLAYERKIGLMLCLWSFDMLRTSYGTGITDRNVLMLNDTAFTNAYVTNALIPIVAALKGHPGIQSWEVFNEPEGMSNEFGWDFTRHVPMASIQRFVNLTAGAVHRTDPSKPVTNGSWSFKAQTDVTAPGPNASVIDDTMRTAFKLHYGADMQTDGALAKVAAGENINYYRNDRLIASGGDPLGTLDFYTVHYYDWAGTSLSPFHYPYKAWKLDKPLVVAEFYLNDTFGKAYYDLYRNLDANGYAGAMSWSWTDNAVNAIQQLRTKLVMDDLFHTAPWDVDPDPVTGKIYAFSTLTGAIERGDTSMLEWKTPPGTTVLLDGVPVASTGTCAVVPVKTTIYSLIASGAVRETSLVTVTVYPTGRILSFAALPLVIAAGESTMLRWSTARGSIVRLNGSFVREDDSLIVSPAASASYTLSALGEVGDSSTIKIVVTSEEKIDRAINKPVIVTSTSPTDVNANPAYLVDGNIHTSWTSAAFEAQSIVIDLEKQYDIKSIMLRWTGNYAAKYRLAVSPENTQWSLLKTQLAGTGGIEFIDSLKGTGRYVKLILDKTGSGGIYGLWEIEIYTATPSVVAGVIGCEILRQFSLFPNYPNPFNPATVISYELQRETFVELGVYDNLGKRVISLVSTVEAAGRHSIRFDGASLASGVYFLRLHAGDFLKTEKMILQR